jgi:hypothetical protein
MESPALVVFAVDSAISGGSAAADLSLSPGYAAPSFSETVWGGADQRGQGGAVGGAVL